MKISACWITKNEQANIERSINSVKAIADELIVVDTGSADDTVEIAKSLGAQVYNFDWIQDFSAARNYTISLVSGDIVIFLDADEWFEPALTPSERAKIVDPFLANPRAFMMSITRISVYKDGIERPDCTVPRIFLKKDNLYYVGRIHEALKFPTNTETIYLSKLSIRHSGYHEDVYPEKVERNLAILESEHANLPKGSDESIRVQIYLIRENIAKKDLEKAHAYMTDILKYPAALKNACRFYSEDFLSLMYILIEAIRSGRTKISRKDVYNKVFALIKKMFHNNPAAVQADLLYQVLFDLKEDRLLKELGSVVAAAGQKKSPVAHYKKYEGYLYEAAAYAAWRRRDFVKAMDYATFALKEEINYHRRTLIILLGAVKGLPTSDVILFLGSILNTQNSDSLELLINATCIDGFLDIHTYYLKKRIDSNNARIADYLRVMMIQKKYEDLARVASEAYADGNTDVASRYIFLAALCGAPKDVIEESAEMLGEYSHILDAFYNHRPLTEVSQYDTALLKDTYDTVACVAGLAVADRYREVFIGSPWHYYKSKAIYCEASGLFDEILGEDMSAIDPLDFDCRRHLIMALIATNRYDQALNEMEHLLNMEVVDQDLIHMLLVVAEKSPKDTSARARIIYDKYAEFLDDLIDLADVLNTGVIPDSEGKRQNKSLKAMTRAQFEKQLKSQFGRTVTKNYLDMCGDAATIYLEKKAEAEAVHCLSQRIAHDYEKKESCALLAGIFKNLGNTALSDFIMTLA